MIGALGAALATVVGVAFYFGGLDQSVTTLESRMERLEDRPTTPGPSAALVAAELTTKYRDQLRGEKGPKGEPGRDGVAPETSAVAQYLATNYAERLRGPAGPKGDTGPKGDQGETGALGPRGLAGAAGPAGQEGATAVAQASLTEEEVREIVAELLAKAITERPELLEKIAQDVTAASAPQVALTGTTGLRAYDPQGFADVLSSEATWQTKGLLSEPSGLAGYYFKFTNKFERQTLAGTFFYDSQDGNDCFFNFSYIQYDEEENTIVFRMTKDRRSKKLFSTGPFSWCGHEDVQNFRLKFEMDGQNQVRAITLTMEKWNTTSELVTSNRFN